MDFDLDPIDAPSKAPVRPARFAPKNSKLKLKPKLEPPPPQTFDSTTKEEFDSKPPPPNSTATTDFEPPKPSVIANGTTKMNIETVPELEEPKLDPMDEDGEDKQLDKDEDQIVREIDVFFTPTVDSNTQLYVLQYPLKPCWRPYELDERCEKVRVKPASAEVEIDLSVDVDSQNYDIDSDKRARMTKQILSSSWKPPRTTGYAVGILVGDKLHLNPVHAVVQLRPSMQHLKPEGSRKRNTPASQIEDAIMSEALREEKSAGPSKKQNKVPGALNEQNNDSGEAWVPLNYHGAKSDISTRYLQKMVVQDGSHIQFLMSPHDYVNSLCPGTSNQNRPKGPSRRFLLSLPLEDRYKTCLLEGPPVHRFDALKHLAPNDTVEDVLGVLKKLAHLIQGLWVPKSSLLFGDDQRVEVLARDYTLLLFSKNPLINYTQLPQKPQLLKAMKDILRMLAVERPSFSDWKFKEPQDISFIKLHPNLVKEQEQTWERSEKLITDIVFGERSRPGIKNSSKPNTVDKPIALKNSNKVVPKASNAEPSKTPMLDETREALPKVLQKIFQTHKACSFEKICERLRDLAVSALTYPKRVSKEVIAAANGVDSPREELRAIISQVAVDIHGIYVSKSSSEYPQYDGLRKIVIDLLIAKGRDAQLKKADIVEAAKMQLKREITANEYHKVLHELCTSQGSSWVLRHGDGNPKLITIYSSVGN